MLDMEELRTSFDKTPYAQFLGMRLVELSQGHAKVALKLRSEHRNWIGATHGGLIMSLADHAFGCALNSTERVYVAAQFSINFLSAPGSDETLYAEATIVHRGRTVGVVELLVKDSNGKLIARATGTSVGLDGVKQPTAQDRQQSPASLQRQSG